MSFCSSALVRPNGGFGYWLYLSRNGVIKHEQGKEIFELYLRDIWVLSTLDEAL